MFGNTGISVFYESNTSIPVLIPVLGSMTLLKQNLNDSPKIGNTGQRNAINAIHSVVSNIITVIYHLFRGNRPNNLTVFVF